ncbi:hypothetical protein C7446_0603 [Kushneria sinocarnis]|uniref:Cation transporter n=1 Tax=Kushneria sinocarnis TaxID=595502 RepID=A0A420WZA6_9GAMM|nr:DUF6482 family protein [Kushneria sinocarnis]RKR06622.1 hypothetical protein C7446_0603 [Kushneria sinocarnis]
MELQQLRRAVREQADLEIHVVRHTGSQLYQVECLPTDGESQLLRRSGKPKLYRSLDAAEDDLRQAGVHRAWLVHQVPNDEVVGRPPNYHHPLTSRIPLSF